MEIIPIDYTNFRKSSYCKIRFKSLFLFFSFVQTGSATFVFQSGVPANLIQAQGDWTSHAYLQYISFSMNDKAVGG